MTSYRRMAHHPFAVARAVHQVRVHALETGPTYPDAVEVDMGQTFQAFMRGLGLLTVELEQVKIPEPAFKAEPPAPVLAYRSRITGRLYCATCPSTPTQFSVPLTSDDLPDGGLCVSCERDVLIVVPSIAPAECPECAHCTRIHNAAGCWAPDCDCERDSI